jgi:hypothetical protein
MAVTLPHYVRFARSLALLGLGATAACGGTTNTPDDAAVAADAFASIDAPSTSGDAPPGTTDAPIATTDAPGTDAPIAMVDDANVPADAFDVCASCTCTFPTPDDAGTDAGLPDCNTVAGGAICCAAIGPLFPPDLAV